VEPLSDQIVAIVAIAVVGGVTLLVALIAAFSAHLWLKRSLKEERARLDDHLKAESRRLGRQLSHERRMCDRDELRTILDDALSVLDELRYGLIAWARDPTEPFEHKYMLNRLQRIANQLRLRLGGDHQVTKSHVHLLETLTPMDEVWHSVVNAESSGALLRPHVRSVR
jgi:molecular chaperone GrpE (heat shock protein)